MFFDSTLFPELQKLRDNYQLIREELLQVNKEQKELLTEDVIRHNYWVGSPNFVDIANNVQDMAKAGWMHWWSPNWNIFGLIFEGQENRLEANCERFPKTMQLLTGIPNIRVAGFSRLLPGATIPPHHGYTGLEFGSLAFHLGLIIPKNADCGIIVGEKKHLWREEGEVIIFDDVFKHTAWNLSEEERIILYIDFAVHSSILERFYTDDHTYWFQSHFLECEDEKPSSTEKEKQEEKKICRKILQISEFWG